MCVYVSVCLCICIVKFSLMWVWIFQWNLLLFGVIYRRQSGILALFLTDYCCIRIGILKQSFLFSVNIILLLWRRILVLITWVESIYIFFFFYIFCIQLCWLGFLNCSLTLWWMSFRVFWNYRVFLQWLYYELHIFFSCILWFYVSFVPQR